MFYHRIGKTTLSLSLTHCFGWLLFQETPAAIIIQPGAGSYQPPTSIVVTNSTSSAQQHGYAPPPQYGYQPSAPYGVQQPGYAQPPNYAQQPDYVPTHDQAGLVKNEII